MEQHPLNGILQLAHVAVERKALQVLQQIWLDRGDAVMQMCVAAGELENQRGRSSLRSRSGGSRNWMTFSR